MKDRRERANTLEGSLGIFDTVGRACVELRAEHIVHSSTSCCVELLCWLLGAER